jgi:hypothetical protein
MERWNLWKSLQEEEWKKTEKNGEDEPNQGMLYTYMKMSQRNTLYNYRILVKMFFKKKRLLGFQVFPVWPQKSNLSPLWLSFLWNMKDNPIFLQGESWGLNGNARQARRTVLAYSKCPINVILNILCKYIVYYVFIIYMKSPKSSCLFLIESAGHYILVLLQLYHQNVLSHFGDFYLVGRHTLMF